MGVDLSSPSPQAVTSEHNVHVMIAKGSAVKGLERPPPRSHWLAY